MVKSKVVSRFRCIVKLAQSFSLPQPHGYSWTSGIVQMHCIISVVAFGCFLCIVGCSDPSANAPTLKLTVERDNGSSVGRYRVIQTGLIAGSGVSGDDGSVVSQAITIDRITDDGVTVTVTITDSEEGGG